MRRSVSYELWRAVGLSLLIKSLKPKAEPS